MAVLQENETLAEREFDLPITADRALTDLALKLPNLFGPDAQTTANEIVRVPGVDFRVGYTHYPKDYVVVTARSSHRFNPLHVSLRDLFGDEDRWLLETSGYLDGQQGFRAEWVGQGDSKSGIVTLDWPLQMPRIEINTVKGVIDGCGFWHRMWELPFGDIVAKSERARDWFKEANTQWPVHVDDFMVDPSQNAVTLNLSWHNKPLPLFPFRMPLVAEVNRVNGVTSAFHKRMHPRGL